MKAYSDTSRLLRIFLCHSSEDKSVVRDLYARLLADGFEPWLDEKKLLPGLPWRSTIATAVRESDIVIVCLSRGSVSKTGFIQKEIKYALDVALEQVEGSIFIVPLKIEECDLPEALSEWQWVNWFDNDGYERLMSALTFKANILGLSTHSNSQAIKSTTASTQEIEKERSKGILASVEVPTAADEHGNKLLPLSVGIETLGGIFTEMFPKGSKLPQRVSQVFSTAEDSQTAVTVHVLVGLRPLTKDNLSLGRFDLHGIPIAPRGIPKIEVVFEIDSRGILNVTATDLATNKRQGVTISNVASINNGDMKRIEDEAEANRENDQHSLDKAETVNSVEAMAYSAETLLKDLPKSVDTTLAKELKDSIKKIREASKTEDIALMRLIKQDLEEKMYIISKKMYQSRLSK
jgi:hypothetical protein